MSQDLKRFLELRAEYQGTRFKIDSIWLKMRFAVLESEVESATVKAAIRKFITEEETAIRKRTEISLAEWRLKRDIQIDQSFALLKEWSLGDIPVTTARGLVRASAWWLSHPSGNPVRAPRHASRLEKQEWGWSLEFGANHFLVGRAIQRASPILCEGLNVLRHGKFLNEKHLVLEIKNALPSCVANYKGDEYESYASRRGRLIFGTQAVDTTDAARFLIQASGLAKHVINFPAVPGNKASPTKP